MNMCINTEVELKQLGSHINYVCEVIGKLCYRIKFLWDLYSFNSKENDHVFYLWSFRETKPLVSALGHSDHLLKVFMLSQH